ncbi:MAG: hypothetical protein WBG27_15305, partial [Candidatus Aquilonibacter sp.]
HVSRRLGTAVSAAAVLSFFQPAPALAAACMGADPAIVSVAVKGMQSSGGLNRYTLSGKVANLGSAGQAPNTLQFVDIYKGSTKLDSRGVPPLRAGQSYAFEYVTERSAQAGAQTTALGFRMDVREPPNTGSQSCNTSNGVTMVRF